MPFSSGSLIWPGLGGVATNPTTTYTDSTSVIQIEEQERWLLGRVILGAGITEDPGLRVRVSVSFDYTAALGIAGSTWIIYSRKDIPHLEVGSHYFEVELPHHCHALVSCRDMAGDADTAITIEGRLRSWTSGKGMNGQPLELRSCQAEGAPAFNNAGAAQVLTANLAVSTSGTWIPVGDASEMDLIFTSSGTVPTAIEIEVQESYSDVAAPAATTIASLPVVNAVAGGDVNVWPGIEQQQSAAGTLANGTYKTRRIAVNPGSMVRVRARRNGGAADTALLAFARFWKVPAE